MEVDINTDSFKQLRSSEKKQMMEGQVNLIKNNVFKIFAKNLKGKT